MTRSNPCIDKLLRDARNHNAWLDKPVGDETLRERLSHRILRLLQRPTSLHVGD
jgi:hypothetical protein